MGIIVVCYLVSATLAIASGVQVIPKLFESIVQFGVVYTVVFAGVRVLKRFAEMDRLFTRFTLTMLLITACGTIVTAALIHFEIIT